ncbi:MAG: hypothetical protein H6735_22905 [Alphaproteobacteria bacterium]|nr:hypothetical protein [Alphaproteobacteria bacterium]
MIVGWAAAAWGGGEDPTVRRYYAACPRPDVLVSWEGLEPDMVRDGRDLDALQGLLLGRAWGADEDVLGLWRELAAELEHPWSIVLIDAAVDLAVTERVCEAEDFWVAVPRLLASGRVGLPRAETRHAEPDVEGPDPPPPIVKPTGRKPPSPWSLAARAGGGPGTSRDAGGVWRASGWADLHGGWRWAFVGVSVQTDLREWAPIGQLGVRIDDGDRTHDLWLGVDSRLVGHAGVDLALAATRGGRFTLHGVVRAGLGLEDWSVAGGLALAARSR